MTLLEWQPIETAPVGDLVLLWQRAWRHPYIGMVTDTETGTVFLESPNYGKGDLTAFADMWTPLPEPPASDLKARVRQLEELPHIASWLKLPVGVAMTSRYLRTRSTQEGDKG